MRSMVLGLTLVVLAACGTPVDVSKTLEVANVTTGWFDAGIVNGKNKLVPMISFQLRNVGPEAISTVQVNAVFRQVGDGEEWGSAFARGIGGDGLPPGESTEAIVLRSELGYTGEQPRAEMLQHSQFVDATVEVFVKHGSAQWTRLAEHPIEREILTKTSLPQ